MPGLGLEEPPETMASVGREVQEGNGVSVNNDTMCVQHKAPSSHMNTTCPIRTHRLHCLWLALLLQTDTDLVWLLALLCLLVWGWKTK